MTKNSDYTKGMRFLLYRCKEANINIHKYPWVCELSRILSYYNSCYLFWANVWQQERLKRIMLCQTPYDIMFGNGKALFIWERTSEGGEFWNTLLARDLFLNKRDIKLEDIRFMGH